MRLIRLTKKIGKATVLGDNPELDINWASGPGFRNGPEDYFCLKVETDHHDFALELNVDESPNTRTPPPQPLHRLLS